MPKRSPRNKLRTHTSITLSPQERKLLKAVVARRGSDEPMGPLFRALLREEANRLGVTP